MLREFTAVKLVLKKISSILKLVYANSSQTLGAGAQVADVATDLHPRGLCVPSIIIKVLSPRISHRLVTLARSKRAAATGARRTAAASIVRLVPLHSRAGLPACAGDSQRLSRRAVTMPPEHVSS
eukprot:6156464-Pleurochrysis_carterae.AAC.2